MKALKVDVTFHWGFIVRQTEQSAAQSPYPYPPPSTLIGALSYGYNKINGNPETIVQNGKIYSSTIKILNGIYDVTCRIIESSACPYQDLGRVISSPYLRVQHRQKLSPFAAQAVGKTYVIKGKLRVIYLVHEEWIDILEKAAFLISRIGSKEGISSVEKVRVVDISSVESDEISTQYYLRSNHVLEIYNEAYHRVTYWDFKDIEAYRVGKSRRKPTEMEYLVNKYDVIFGGEIEPMELKIDVENAVIYDVDGELIVTYRGDN